MASVVQDFHQVTRRRELTCHLLAFAFAASIVMPVAILGFNREAPFKAVEGYTVPLEIEPGKDFRMSFLVTQNKQCPGLVYLQIVDAEKKIHVMEPQASIIGVTDLPDEPTRSVGRSRILPSSVAPGPATITVYTKFWCNWVHYLFPVETVAQLRTKVVPPKKNGNGSCQFSSDRTTPIQ